MGSFEDNQNISFLGTKNALNKPVVEQYSEYIGIFKGVGSSAPMIIDNSSFFLTYLVDSQGQPTKIPSEGPILKDATSNFIDTPTALFRLDQPTQLNENLAGEHKVTSVGTPTPILYSQIGVGINDHVPQLNLLPPGIEPVNSSGVPNITADLDKSTVEELYNLTGPGDFEYIGDFDTKNSDGPDVSYVTTDLGQLSGTGSFTFDGTQLPNSLNHITFTANVTIRSRGFLMGLQEGESCEFVLSLYKEDSGGSVSVPVAQPRTISRPFSGGGGRAADENDYFLANFNFQHTIQAQDIANGDKFYLLLIREPGDSFVVEISSARFKMLQDPPPENPPNFDAQTPFWETGSATVLTASAYLSEQYGNLQRELTSSLDFGFPPIKDPFTVSIGDKIRFEYNKENVFTVYDVISPASGEASGSRLYLTINQSIPSNINTNNFVLYRILNNGQFITVDTQKNENEDTEFTGIVIPKYINPTFQSNINEITQQLKQDGIIEE